MSVLKLLKGQDTGPRMAAWTHAVPVRPVREGENSTISDDASEFMRLLVLMRYGMDMVQMKVKLGRVLRSSRALDMGRGLMTFTKAYAVKDTDMMRAEVDRMYALMEVA